jgi:hypothetical protein
MFTHGKPVERTSHISFDTTDKTFRIYSGNSIYAFCISPELILEHLHWGESVLPGYDLRYLSQSSRMMHFNVIEAAPDKFSGQIVLEAETLEEIQATWRENRVWSPQDMDDQERFLKRRLENYAWRIMSKVSMTDAKKMSPEVSKSIKSVASTADLRSFMAKNVNRFKVQHCESEQQLLKYAPSEGNLLKLATTPKKSTECSFKNYKHPILENLPGKLRQQQRHRNADTFGKTFMKIGKGGLCVEYSDHGTGDFRNPSFIAVDNYNGSSISPLRYRKHRIYKGKLEIPDGLPAARCLDENEASTLVVTLADVISGLEVDLIYGKSTDISKFVF